MGLRSEMGTLPCSVLPITLMLQHSSISAFAFAP